MYNAGRFIFDMTMVITTICCVKTFLGLFFEKRRFGTLSAISWLIFGIFQLFTEYHSGTASIWTTVASIALVLLVAVSNYREAGKIKLFIVVLLHAVWVLVEMMVFFCMNHVLAGTAETNIFGEVLSKMLVVIGIYLFSCFWKKKAYVFIPIPYFFALMFIPVGSIYIAAHEFFSNGDGKNAILSMITFSVLLLFNIVIFEISTRLTENFMLEKEKAMYEQQMDIMSRSTEEQKKIMEDFREEKHNLVNKLVALKNSIESDDRVNVIENLNRIIKLCNVNEKISNSGNAVVDALINFKYAAAKEQGIEFRLKVTIPEVLPINQCDIGIVLGNALDNAIEAVKGCERHEKIIEIFIGIKKEALVFVVKNPFEHVVKADNAGNLQSTKTDSYRHGYGVNSIKRAAERYHGEADYDIQEDIFIMTIMMNLGEF